LKSLGALRLWLLSSSTAGRYLGCSSYGCSKVVKRRPPPHLPAPKTATATPTSAGSARMIPPPNLANPAPSRTIRGEGWSTTGSSSAGMRKPINLNDIPQGEPHRLGQGKTRRPRRRQTTRERAGGHREGSISTGNCHQVGRVRSSDEALQPSSRWLDAGAVRRQGSSSRCGGSET
jgi:hypothetical protein